MANRGGYLIVIGHGGIHRDFIIAISEDNVAVQNKRENDN